MNLLLVGVGGVGCEFLILLEDYYSLNVNNYEIFETIVIIDDDIVEESNLNRQRLFKREDIGRSKVESASESLKKLKVTPLKLKVESINDSEFFSQFDFIILAVDNLETRRWMNSTIFQFGKLGFFLLDLGVEGFKFSLRSFRNGTACLECTMYLHNGLDDGEEEANVPICSIYGEPRNIKDCIYWALNQDFNDVKAIYELVKGRAKEFGIDSSNLSYKSIERLRKRAIPAVCSVNSLLAAKGLEIVISKATEPETGLSHPNFWLVNLENGIYEYETCLEKNLNCFICGKESES